MVRGGGKLLPSGISQRTAPQWDLWVASAGISQTPPVECAQPSKRPPGISQTRCALGRVHSPPARAHSCLNKSAQFCLKQGVGLAYRAPLYALWHTEHRSTLYALRSMLCLPPCLPLSLPRALTPSLPDAQCACTRVCRLSSFLSSPTAQGQGREDKGTRGWDVLQEAVSSVDALSSVDNGGAPP